MRVLLNGETIELLAQRALYWPVQRMLLIADAHFGKAAAFRAHGMPVPRGTTRQNLAVIDDLLMRHDVGQLVFLGDFLHARAARAAATLQELRSWRAQHPGLRIVLVRGNHDRHAGDPPADFGIEVVEEPWRIGPFALCHDPQVRDDGYVIAGHVHPVVRLATRHDALRLACFVLGPERAILPAFGAFTGGHPVNPKDDEAVYLIADERIWPLPRSGSAAA